MKYLKYLLSTILFLLFVTLSAQDNKYKYSHKHSFKSSVIGDTIDAVHYDIYLENIDTEAETIQAYTKVQFTPKVDNLNSVPLELLDLTVDAVFIDGVEITTFTHVDGIIHIPLSNPVNTNDTLIAEVHYHGQPFHEEWGGFHFSGNYAFNLGVGFESDPHNLGKSWFPCVDDFTDRATYDCFVTVADTMKAVCGGTLIETTDNGNNTLTFHWQLPQTIPTYLASVAVGEYELVDDIYNGINGDIPINIYVRPFNTANVSGSFVNLKEIMNFFETHFGAYPWDRIGYVETAKGAMEHATSIAYPYGCINGSLNYEWLYTHELSHMWFGDKVTCSTAGDMWLNEGWAVFCEMYYLNDLYSAEDFKNTLRDKHAWVLQYCHTSSGDGSYMPLYGVPTQYTYGETVYDKGSTVVQSMRAYLGDSIFFDAATAYLEEFAYNSASSYDMRDFLTDYTGIDMTDFFEAWVFTAGTPHFSIDSFAIHENGANFDVDLYSKQKYKGVDFLANSNIVEVNFIDEEWNIFSDTIHFSGKTGHSVKQLSFEPIAVFIDLNEKTCDATTDNYQIVNTTGEHDFSKTYCMLNFEEISDSAFVRVTHNWAAPDSLKNPIAALTLSDYRYWKIEGIFPENFSATARFFYSRTTHLDDTLLANQEDSLVILYRENASVDWQGIDFYRIGNSYIGSIFVENAQPGEYTLAVWDAQYVGENKLNKNELKFEVFPNPSSESFTFVFETKENSILKIYDSSSKLVKSFNTKKGENIIKWVPTESACGTYFLQLVSEDKIQLNKKLLYLK